MALKLWMLLRQVCNNVLNSFNIKKRALCCSHIFSNLQVCHNFHFSYLKLSHETIFTLYSHTYILF